MPESEKITININAVDLGKIDLLVQEGVYTNRTDFIRTAIRLQLARHEAELNQSVARHAYGVGFFQYARKDLERCKARGEKLKITVVGMLDLAPDIPPDLAAEVIEYVQVRGIFQASQAVRDVLADRMR